MTVESRIVVIDNWLEYRYIQDPKVGNDQKFFSIPLPLFKNSFPFIVCTGYETINIVNVNTMQMFTLISAPCKNIKSQQAIFFKHTKPSHNFEMHFSTQTTTDYGSTLYNWYCMEFKDDFVQYLTEE